MIASIFVFFVAAGITLASLVVGYGGLFPLLAALVAVAVLFRAMAVILRRPDVPRT